MRGGALIATLVAVVLTACSTKRPEPPPTSTRESERAPSALPDAYKHPPK